MKQKFHWQPEIATSIIYWSVTFFIFFFSLIMALERTYPYPKSILVTCFSLLLMWLGAHRYLIVDEKNIYVNYARLWKKVTIPINEIMKIRGRNNHLLIETTSYKLECTMSKKTQARLLNKIESIKKNSIE